MISSRRPSATSLAKILTRFVLGLDLDWHTQLAVALTCHIEVITTRKADSTPGQKISFSIA